MTRRGLGNLPDPLYPYSERGSIYNPPPGSGIPGTNVAPPIPRPEGAISPGYVNNIHFANVGLTGAGTVTPFNANFKRVFLLVQNNDTVINVFVNFGTGFVQNSAILLTPGQSLTLDTVCPYDAVAITTSGIPTGSVVAVEGTAQPMQYVGGG